MSEQKKLSSVVVVGGEGEKNFVTIKTNGY